MRKHSELVSISLINEELKQVFRQSRNVYMAALNAMFIARKINSGNVSGFSSVTKELQTFSHRLNELTHVVEKDISTAISNSATSIKTHRMSRLFAVALGHEGNELPELSRRRSRDKMDEKLVHADLLKELDRKHLMNTLNSLEKHCGIGNSLSVLAKIESSTVGQFTEELSAISSQIETVIYHMQVNIEMALSLHTKAA